MRPREAIEKNQQEALAGSPTIRDFRLAELGLEVLLDIRDELGGSAARIADPEDDEEDDDEEEAHPTPAGPMSAMEAIAALGDYLGMRGASIGEIVEAVKVMGADLREAKETIAHCDEHEHHI